MTLALSRIVTGVALMVLGCAPAAILGNRPVRLATAIIAACWALVAAAQVATGLIVEPVMVGEIVSGLGLLAVAMSFDAKWLWVEIAIEAALLLLHAWFYEQGEVPSANFVTFSNLLTTVGLGVLVAAAIRWQFRPAGDCET